MDRLEFVETQKLYDKQIETLKENFAMMCNAYIAEHSPFEASWKSPVLCEVTYQYVNDPYDKENPSGTVSGLVYVVGFELADFYGEQAHGYIIPKMVRISESTGYVKEGVHFRVSTDFSTVKVIPMNELKDEKEDEPKPQDEHIPGLTAATVDDANSITSAEASETHPILT